MKIKKIIFQEDQYFYPIIFDYFHPFLLRFCYRNEIEFLNTDNLTLTSNHLLEFKKVVHDALKELLDECYVEPTHEHRSKFGSRYEKIFVDGIQYVVDYRTNYIGKIMYGLYYLLTWAEKHIHEEKIITQEEDF